MENNKMLTVTVYADTTGYFSEKEINILLDCAGWGNIADILVPEKLLREFYEQNEKPEFQDFDRWFNEEYTCDDTDGLVDFVIARTGERPELADSYYNDCLMATLEDYKANNEDDEVEDE